MDEQDAYAREVLEPGQDDVIKPGGPGLFARATAITPRTPTDEYLYTDHEPTLRGLRHGVSRTVRGHR